MAKVLVVDDDETLLTMYEQILEARGFNVIGERDGARAIEVIKKERPTIILLDLLLPGKSGLDILGEIRSDSTTKTIPVIILTVLTDEAKQSEAKAAGANRFFNKADSIPGDIVKAIEEELKK